jgi:hypothetical protein
MTTIQIEIPEYQGKGLSYIWDPDFIISTEIDRNSQTVIIKANQAGLTSLARHLLTLAQPKVPIGFHHHFDENNPLEVGSISLIVEKI